LEVANSYLGNKPHQKDLKREDVHVQDSELTNIMVPGGTITEEGLRLNISVALQYLNAWLQGNGAAAINNLMEDAATAEIARAQLWQWIHSPRGVLNDGRKVTLKMYRQFADEEMDKIRAAWGDANYARSRIAEAREIVDTLVASPECIEFLTLRAYERLV
jgi:malate synthase